MLLLMILGVSEVKDAEGFDGLDRCFTDAFGPSCACSFRCFSLLRGRTGSTSLCPPLFGSAAATPLLRSCLSSHLFRLLSVCTFLLLTRGTDPGYEEEQILATATTRR